ncbi:hypothetical protein K438DRAFT_1873084 [Mycena galopus ATCC 62051]|nr:hypothetical protein K438DRAFT_1873084 [Mycena galopus ATCC 62051]
MPLFFTPPTSLRHPPLALRALPCHPRLPCHFLFGKHRLLSARHSPRWTGKSWAPNDARRPSESAAQRNVLQVHFDAAGLPHSQPAWIGRRVAEDGSEAPPVHAPPPSSFTPIAGMGPQIYTQEQVDALSETKGFTYVPWLGECAAFVPLSSPSFPHCLSRLSVPVVDSHRRLILLLGGKPRDLLRWQTVTDTAAHLMDTLFHRGHFKPEDSVHRRAHPDSQYHPLSVGAPGELQNHPDNVAIANEMLAHECFGRFSGFTNCLMRVFAPLLAAFCASQLALLADWNSALRWPFVGSVFAACTFNFGPRAATCPHLDFGNLAWSWCAITALGWFDADLGGHLILWDLKLVIRFPAVQRHEKRFSFTQYSAGGLFRWIRNGFMTDEAFEMMATKAAKEARAAEAETRWEEGVQMFSTLDDLKLDA